MVSEVLTSIHLTSSDEPRSTEVQRLVGVLKCHMSHVIRIPVGGFRPGPIPTELYSLLR